MFPCVARGSSIDIIIIRRLGILNPNRRHDDPEEKQADMVRAEINAGHRFHSFANERAENFVKWHVEFLQVACSPLDVSN